MQVGVLNHPLYKIRRFQLIVKKLRQLKLSEKWLLGRRRSACGRGVDLQEFGDVIGEVV
jgi:hypothetical protein